VTEILVATTGGGPRPAVEVTTDLAWPPPDRLPADGGAYVLVTAWEPPWPDAGVYPSATYAWTPDGPGAWSL
jgi:hypothetical protein